MIDAPPRSAWLLLLGGLAGWLASVTLTVERIRLYTDSGYRPSCSINPILSCGTVMERPQASVFFDMPNPLIGIVGFSVVVTLGVLAVAGTRIPRWVWGGLWLGTLLGTGFICWLIFQSLYRINALCPYCMVVWVIIVPLLAVLTQILWGGSRGPLGVAAEWRWTVVAVYYAVVLLLVFLRFQDYWMTLV